MTCVFNPFCSSTLCVSACRRRSSFPSARPNSGQELSRSGSRLQRYGWDYGSFPVIVEQPIKIWSAILIVFLIAELFMKGVGNEIDRETREEANSKRRSTLIATVTLLIPFRSCAHSRTSPRWRQCLAPFRASRSIDWRPHGHSCHSELNIMDLHLGMFEM